MCPLSSVLGHVLPPPESPAPKFQKPELDCQTAPVAPAQMPIAQTMESQNSEKHMLLKIPAGFPCQVGSEKCHEKILANTTRLHQQYSRHYIRSLRKSLDTTLNRFMNECCKKFVDNKQDSIVHIGTQHKKIHVIVFEYKEIDLEAMDRQQSPPKKNSRWNRGKQEGTN